MGLQLVAKRGALMQEACNATVGTMTTLLGANAEQAREIAEACNVDVANLNCPGQIVLSGGVKEMEGVRRVAKEKGVRKVSRSRSPARTTRASWQRRRRARSPS
jgi:[acyl-carrier-protein] S-malonyltransferase